MKGPLMKRWILLLVIMLLAASAAGCTVTGRGSGAGSSTDGNSNEKGADEMRERYETTDGETGYIYLPSSSEESGNKTYPLVIMMNGTAQDPIHDAEGTGWIDLAQEKDIILLVPEYDDYATYSNVDTLISVLDYIEDKYPVDETRVYSTGFSNGGAMSVALAAEHPERFAAISAYGWMVDMMYEDPMADQYDMPFQVLQGTREYTGKNSEGSPVIMLDEREAVRSLFLFNEMITDDVRPDYRKTPYWGYEPSSIEKRNADGTALTISSYKKDGYKNPFAQLVLIDGETHRVHPYDAGLAWDFMKKFQRNKDGSISER
jgi:poly(3-hydroxybutyrate) depolymerase